VLPLSQRRLLFAVPQALAVSALYCLGHWPFGPVTSHSDSAKSLQKKKKHSLRRPKPAGLS
jgi:hypothetical protein